MYRPRAHRSRGNFRHLLPMLCSYVHASMYEFLLGDRRLQHGNSQYSSLTTLIYKTKRTQCLRHIQSGRPRILIDGGNRDRTRSIVTIDAMPPATYNESQSIQNHLAKTTVHRVSHRGPLTLFSMAADSPGYVK